MPTSATVIPKQIEVKGGGALRSQRSGRAAATADSWVTGQVIPIARRKTKAFHHEEIEQSLERRAAAARVRAKELAATVGIETGRGTATSQCATRTTTVTSTPTSQPASRSESATAGNENQRQSG